MIAYLNTRYPSLSHTFIEREVRALRAEGFEVRTFSIHPPRPADTLGEAHAAAARETFVIMPSLPSLLLAQVPAFLKFPLGYLRALVDAQRISTKGLKARVDSLGYAWEAARLALQCARAGVTHIHVHMANNGAAVALLACVVDPRLKYSLTIHGSAEFFDVHRLNLKAKTERAMFVRCISSFCKAQVMAWSTPAAWERFHIVHCGVDPARLAPASERAAPPEGAPLRILTVGRLEPIKGYPLLLDACADLSRRGVAWRLEMVGSGPMEKTLRERATTLGIADRVAFPGPISQEDMPAAYERSDVLVVSSFMEGVPVVLMEAMAKELFVVSTAVGGVPELIEPGVNGLVVPPANATAMSDALETLARGRVTLSPLRKAAREKILREFSTEQNGREMAELFRSYLGAVPRGTARGGNAEAERDAR